MLGECVISLVLSCHNKNLKWRTSSQMEVLLLHVTAQVYLENKGKYILEAWGMLTQKSQRERRDGRRGGESEGKQWERERQRETPGPLTPLFMFFLLPLGLPYVNWASQGCCLFYLRSSLWSSDPPLFCFHGLFPSLSFSHHHPGLLFPFLTT